MAVGSAREAAQRRAGSPGEMHYLHIVQPPGGGQAASILAGVRVADHALLAAPNVGVVPLVGQQALHGGLTIVQVVQGLKQGGHPQSLCHPTLSLHRTHNPVCKGLYSNSRWADTCRTWQLVFLTLEIAVMLLRREHPVHAARLYAILPCTSAMQALCLCTLHSHRSVVLRSNVHTYLQLLHMPAPCATLVK